MTLAPRNPAPPTVQTGAGVTDVRPIRCLLCGAVVAYRVSTASKRELRTVRPCRIESAVVDVGFCEPRCGTLADDAA